MISVKVDLHVVFCFSVACKNAKIISQQKF